MEINSDINHSSCVSEDISRLFLDERHSDVSFVVEGKRIAAHKVVLAARSSAFKDLLFERTPLIACKREIHINDCSVLSFKNFIKYIYTGKISLTDMSEPERQEMLALALKYQMKQLVESILEPNSQSSDQLLSPDIPQEKVKTGKPLVSKVKTSSSLQFEDLANVEKGAIVIEGLNPEKLFSGRREFDEKSLTKHKIESHSKGVIIKLNIPVLINIIRFRLLDIESKRYYSYYVQVSSDSLNWEVVADHQYFSCRSMQTIVFSQRLVQFIQIVGTHSNEKSFFSNTRYFPVVSFLCGVTKKSSNLVNGFWEPESNVASVGKGAVVAINGNDFCRNAKMINDSIDFEYKKYNHICSEFSFDADSQLMVLMPQPIVTSSLSFYIYSDQKFKYTVKISVDPIDKELKKWTVVADRHDKFGSSKWQRITFTKTLVSIICIERIRCLNESITTFPILSFTCP